MVNHGLDKEFLLEMFDESKKFFSVPLEEKMKLSKKEHRGYTALYAEKLDPTSRAQGLGFHSLSILLLYHQFLDVF